MAVRELGDPRLEAMFGIGGTADAGVRPLVQPPRTGAPAWVYVAAAGLAAILLFVVLESRRQAPVETSVTGRAAQPVFQSEPPLYIPPAAQTAPLPMLLEPVARGPVPLVVPRSIVPRAVTVAPSPQQATSDPSTAVHTAQVPTPAPPAVRNAAGVPLVMDNGAPPLANGETPASRGTSGELFESQNGRRIRASSLANRSSTVAQGTLIPAVLETAFNSTRAGLARAIVSRNVRGFDGTHILIPRGSRLVGEYKAEVASGQNRAIIVWTRLIRPDGVTIGLNSPAVDPLGRGGIPARVNTHFFARFAEALLHTTLGLGSNLATRAATGNVVVALPGAVQSAGPQFQGSNAMPTLTIPAGKSISVFVAHDLDFSSGSETQ